MNLKSDVLKKLDVEIFDLTKEYSMALNSLGKIPNIYAYKDFFSKYKIVLKKLKSVKTNDKFEKLFVRNCQENLLAMQTYLEFFTFGKENDTESFVKKIWGERAIKIIQEGCKNFNYKSYWEYYLAFQNYTYKQLPSDDESFRQTFKDLLADIKKDVLEYGKKKFRLPQDYDFEAILDQPYSHGAYFHPTNKRMQISPSYFSVYKENNEVKINVCDVMRTMFHEILGHGNHEAHSRKSSLCLQNNSINTCVAPLHVHFEGVSQFVEEGSLEFMKQHKKKYKIEEDYIRQCELSLKNDSSSFQIYWGYLRMKEFQGEKVSVNKEMKAISGNNGLAMIFDMADNSPIRAIRNIVYPLGKFYLKEIIENLKKKYKKDYDKNWPKINEAMMTGVWNFSVLQDWIEYFVEEK